MGQIKEKIGLAVAGGVFQILVYVCVILLLIALGKYTYHFGYEVFNQQAMSPGEGQEITIVIKEGASVYDIAKVLENYGLIEDAKVFWVQEKISLYKDKLQPGTYVLSTAYTPNRIMEILSASVEEEEES